MTDEELKNKCAERAKIFQQAMESCHSSSPMDCIEWFADRIAELEAEVKEWKDKADLWCKTANLKDHNIMINKELEKENAELEKEVTRLRNENLDIINKYTRFAETDRKTITKLQQACHKWFMRWREAKKDAMNLQKENAELKEKIRLMNEQEARDITSRFPC